MSQRTKIQMTTERILEPCDNCHLDCKPLQLYGSQTAPYLVVTKAPVRSTNIRYFSPGITAMSHEGMAMFLQEMVGLGFNIEDFRFQAGVLCHYDRDLWIARQRTEIERNCREWILREIDWCHPECIIALGADAAKQVWGRAVKISKVRGVPMYNEDLDCHVLALHDPDIVHIRPQHLPLFRADCKTFARMVDHAYDLEAVEQEVIGEYEIVDDLQFLIDEEPPILSYDMETVGLRWAEPDKRIVSMQFSTQPGSGFMVTWDHPEAPKSMRAKARLRNQLERLLTNPNTSVLGQNLKFDAVWLLARLGIRFRIDHDTLMMAALIDENLQNKDLDTLIKIYVPAMSGYADFFNSKYDKSRMDLVPLDDLLPYGVGDTDAALRLFNVLHQHLLDDELLYRHYRYVSIPAINAFRDIERRGMLIDLNRLSEFQAFMEQEVEDQRQSLLAQVPRSIKRQAVRQGKSLKFSRPDFVRQILFTHPDGFQLEPRVFTAGTQRLPDDMKVPSTSAKEHLPFFFDECPFTIELAQHAQDRSLLNTNIKKFRENFVVGDHIYPVYSMWTANTGRSASRDPNGQNFPNRGPKAVQYRRMFVAPPGYAILGADLSQAELRIAGDMAQDPVMIGIYQRGEDIHRATAADAMQTTLQQFAMLPVEEQSLARKKAKAINFGFLYGMWWRRFVHYAKTEYGIDLTPLESQDFRRRFFAMYPRLEPWHEETKEFAHQHGYVRSYTGRVRHLPMIHSDDAMVQMEAERQAINSPVQESASSFGLISMAAINQEIDPQYLAIFGFVHDAIYCLAPYEYIEWGAKTLKYYMETNDIEEMFGTVMQVPMVADVSVGLDTGAMVELEGLELDEDYNWQLAEDLPFELPDQEIPPDDGRIEVPEHLVIGFPDAFHERWGVDIPF